MTVTAIRTRMYNVGFGDAFLLTLEHTHGQWRMLIDCGVHPGGGSEHKIAQIVTQIITDLAVDGAAPHLDVVVATHRHRDHVSGFENDAWDTVTVGEVWMPFTENPDDDLGRSIKEEQARKARRLHAHLTALAAAGDRDAARAAHIVENDLTNAEAMTRLHQGFASSARRRYFPDAQHERGSFALDGLPDVRVHMLGPRRDRAVIAAMDPPADQHWLQLLDQPTDSEQPVRPLFPATFHTSPQTMRRDYRELYLTDAQRVELVTEINVDAFAAAASIASATNNTSLVFVLDVGGTKLLFPGDAQWGLWDAILGDPDNDEVLADTRLYKVGHHGSHNATHKRYVDDLMGDHTTSLMSFHPVKDWPSIPNENLLAALEHGPRTLIRSDEATNRRNLRWNGTIAAEYTITLHP